jgi:hypothetical protein
MDGDTVFMIVGGVLLVASAVTLWRVGVKFWAEWDLYEDLLISKRDKR